MLLKLWSISILVFLSTVRANVIRCDLIDPHSRESDLCWEQFMSKNYPAVSQIDEEADDNVAVPLHTRNTEFSTALMQLFGLNKLNGKRNPEFSRDVVRFMSDISPYTET